MLLLGIETATKVCSVAISDTKRLLAKEEAGGAYSHAEKLISFIQHCLKKAAIDLIQLDAIVVSKGPGSYTGLRIGVSTAKGLCYALNKPLIAINTLQAMAFGVIDEQEEPTLYCPMIDARRQEVYTALFDKKNNPIEQVTAKIIDKQSFANKLARHKIAFFGDGAEKCRGLLEHHPNAMFYDKGEPSAVYINQLAEQRLQQRKFEDLAYFEPYYLKDFVATVPKQLLS